MLCHKALIADVNLRKRPRFHHAGNTTTGLYSQVFTRLLRLNETSVVTGKQDSGNISGAACYFRYLPHNREIAIRLPQLSGHHVSLIVYPQDVLLFLCLFIYIKYWPGESKSAQNRRVSPQGRRGLYLYPTKSIPFREWTLELKSTFLLKQISVG